MAITYSLELATDMTSAQALRLIAEHFGFKWSDDNHLSGPSVSISAIEMTGSWREIMEEGFHFSPELSVGFRISNLGNHEEGTRFMLRATMLLLDRSRDGVLLCNGERIILQRLGGQLVLNEDEGCWTDGFRLENEIQLPHEKRSLPSPLL
ncbi:SitI3 family protein [Vitiosangium sp. GDMCC 1.1324]|uniref:SitI3 family protein n=1 Tax=Vitiosangium sp. (strain GDMCC 1.1324) TaxID=2138576 RepID=UPI000D3B265C|nr:SitI3 family protein [Vitiosangium sp. GDMCC 1.1324]PTL85469.1 hypothetical protein DAT35_01750 [Vitiosangium sp. GDMCC 1.1324]